MARFAKSFLFAQSIRGGVALVEDEVVLLQAHAQARVKPTPALNSPAELSEREHNAEALAQTYENMVRDVMQKGPKALPTDAVLDPAISQFDVLKVELRSDKATQQDAVNEANAALTACNTNLNNAVTKANVGADDLAAAVDAARATHRQCRIDENAVSGTQDAQCGAFTAAASGSSCHSEDWLTEHGDGLVAAAKACTAAKTAVTDTAPQCDRDQKNFEETYCAYATVLTGTCETYTGCRSVEEERRTAAYDTARELEESHKRIWVAYEKAVCFLNLLKEARGDDLTEDKLNGCIQLQPDTSALDMDYPDAAPVQDCSTSHVATKPGEDAWRAAEYGASPFTDRPENLEPTDVCPQGAVQVPDNFLHTCDHEDGWDYVLDYGDDRSKDDIPDNAADIGAGFSNQNAYYIGNEELEKLELEEVQICALVSGKDCNANCFTLTDDNGAANSWVNSNNIPGNCFPELTSPLKRVIGVFTGQCTDQHYIFLHVPNDSFAKFSGDISHIAWQCRGYRRFYTWSGSWRGWHAEGWGLTLSTAYNPNFGANYEFGWYDSGTCGAQSAGANADVFQIRVKVKGR